MARALKKTSHITISKVKGVEIPGLGVVFESLPEITSPYKLKSFEDIEADESFKPKVIRRRASWRTRWPNL